jgi:hypothetical protein
MMQLTKAIPIIIWSILVIIVSGCASQPKHFIPDNLPELSPDMARIIVTREKQLAGAGSPMIVLDIGQEIHSNAMLHIKDTSVKEILNKENFASIHGLTSDQLWLWFDAKSFKPLFCSIDDPTCIKYHREWPRIERGQLLYGIMINIKDNCIVDFGYEMNDTISEKIWREELKPAEVTELEGCDDIRYQGTARVVSFIPFIDKLIAKDYFKNLLEKKIQGYRIPDVEGCFVPVNLVPESYINKYHPFFPIDFSAENIDLDQISREVLLIGSIEVGGMLIWDRAPGLMRLGAAWHDGLGFMPENIAVESNKTYFIHYTTRAGQRWELTNVE